MKPKRKMVYVTRDGKKSNNYSVYSAWSKHPSFYAGFEQWEGYHSLLFSFSDKLMEKYIGLKLRGGKDSIVKGYFKFIKEKL